MTNIPANKPKRKKFKEKMWLLFDQTDFYCPDVYTTKAHAMFWKKANSSTDGKWKVIPVEVREL